MDLKLKENVNIHSPIFKKKIITETLELFGDKHNYVDNDIEFYTMITFTNNLVENNLVIESLYNVDDIEEKVSTIVEPLFKTEVMEKPERLEVYNNIVEQVTKYMDREVNINMTIAGMLNNLVTQLGTMNIEDIMNVITNTIEKSMGKKWKKQNNKNKEIEKSDEDIKADALKDIENEKIRVLMEQFARKTQEIKDTQE